MSLASILARRINTTLIVVSWLLVLVLPIAYFITDFFSMEVPLELASYAGFLLQLSAGVVALSLVMAATIIMPESNSKPWLAFGFAVTPLVVAILIQPVMMAFGVPTTPEFFFHGCNAAAIVVLLSVLSPPKGEAV
jgi:hypothetical protein